MSKEFDNISNGSGPEGPVGVRRKRANSMSIDEPPGMCDGGLKGCLLNNLMLIFLLIGIIAGIVVGVLIRQYHPDWSDDTMEAKRNRMYLAFPGDLFLRMLKCMIIPLIVASLISGMAGLPQKSAGRIGGFAVLYYMITTLFAVIVGIILVVAIKPGSYAEQGPEKERIQQAEDFILDLIRNVFPNNIIAATFRQTKTSYGTRPAWMMVNITDDNGTMRTVNKSYSEIISFSTGEGGGSNILGLVVFSVVLGLIVGKLGETARTFKECVDGLSSAIIEMVKLIIWFAPVGICFLLAERIVRMSDPLKEFTALAVYMGTVAAGLAIHAFIVLPIIYVVFVRKNPFVFALNMLQAILTALGTASSSATLPLTMRCMELKARVDRRIGNFVLPVGATINMDGTALYEAVAAIFIAQVNRIELNAGETITVAITSTAAAIGAAGVPEAGLVTMSIVLTAVGLPLEDVALILTVDWLLDRLRTSVNVWGDSIGCGVVEALCKKQLEEMDAEEDFSKPAPLTNNNYSEMEEKAKARQSGIGHHNPVFHSDDL